MRRIIVILLSASCIGLLAGGLGCASSVVWVRQGEVPELKPGQGLLVFDLDTDQYVQLLATDGFVAAREVAPGKHFAILAVDAGSYTWTRLEVPGFDMPGWRDWEWKFPLWKWEEGALDFEVRAGSTSYGGMLLIRELVPANERFWLTNKRLDIRRINRSAMVLGQLERDYAELLAKYPFEYTGGLRDEFYRSLERARAAAP